MKQILSACTLLATLIFSGSVVGQQRRPLRWGGGVDDEQLHFGFSFHYIQADYKVALKPDWRAPYPEGNIGTWTEIYSPFQQGIGLGLLADLKLTENTNFRFTPTLVFSNKEVKYQGLSPSAGEAEQLTALVRASYIDLPLMLKLKSDRKGNYRGYLIGGGKYSVNVVSGKRYNDSGATPREKLLKTKPAYFSYEAGIGFDIYFDYFKMSPEIRWVQSMGNLLHAEEPNMYNHPIDRLTLRNMQISIFFE